MKAKFISKILATAFCVVSTHAFSREFSPPETYGKSLNSRLYPPVTPFTYDLDPLIVINQNINQKGLVVMSGKLTKPFTSDHIKLSIRYQDAQGNWVTGWCKTLYSYNQYNEILTARFELPASAQSSYKVKVELSSDTNLSNFNSVVWDKSISHYKLSDYVASNCDLDENEYTMLLTPKKDGSLITNSSGKVVGVKDRVTSAYSWNKLSNVLMDNKKNDVVFAPTHPSDLIADANGSKAVKLVNTGAVSDTLGATPEFIYNEAAGHPIPYLYSYDDPVYMFAGKFSANGLFVKFSQWPGEPNGPGYFNWKSPTFIESRYFNMYNRTWKNLAEFIPDQEPVVIVSSITTGLRIYKNDGTYIDLTPNSTSNYGAPYFGYTNNVARRGPGSENLIISNTSEMTLYGVGALRNDVTTSYQPKRTMQDVEKEVFKFIKYTGVFGSTMAYDDTSECSLGCFTVNTGAVSDYSVADWTKAPNSYIFTGKDKTGNSADGLYIPVKKAFAMWKKDKYIGGSDIPAGQVTADVLWEDAHGLIKSGINYSLEMIGSGEDAMIKVPVNKAKKGNAVIALKVGGEVYWSWHIWVTDDPTNGSAYKSFAGLKRQKKDGTVELIPDSDWGWMDRNLGAMSNSLTSGNWNKNGGLLYQWGRKDPIPPLTAKGNDSYEVSGSIGRIRHRNAQYTANSVKIDALRKFVPLASANVKNNLSLAVKNPLSLIYVGNNSADIAYYDSAKTLMLNWFGKSPDFGSNRLSELNLWSDNSEGKYRDNYLGDDDAQPYKNKSSYDPCPNGWRVPSVLVANGGSKTYIDDIRIDFSPLGVKTNMGKNAFEANSYQIIKPTDAGAPNFMKGFKLYTNVGYDLSSIGGFNMGKFPGTGQLLINRHEGQYTDQHHTALWTATMTRHFDASPSIVARALFLVPDKEQPDIPDPSYPNINGRYFYQPLSMGETSGANGCRCIKDPLYVVNDYDFPTDYFAEGQYMDGLDNPNTYTMVKSTAESTIEIPISKAFSAQSQLLNNPDVLNASGFDNLKTNVLWTTDTGLIKQVSVDQPGSLSAISSSKIKVIINPNKSGNAVVTLHNGSITNPVYWSWHIWVTNTAIGSNRHITDQPDANAVNYINFAKRSEVLDTEIMDRNLGAVEVFPTIYGDNLNPETALPGSPEQIMLSGGLHYQWGRKDPIPTYRTASDIDYGQYRYKTDAVKYWTGTTAANGIITYAPLVESNYNTNYIRPYATYSNSANANVVATDKPSEKIAKVLSYSVKNPLAFMVPSTLDATGKGSDWLAAEPNLGADRWGRGDKKSPFDPCPEGWRIPDVTTVSVISVPSNPVAQEDFGLSPWYRKSYRAASAYRIITDNFGTQVRVGKRRTAGFMFPNSDYTIGNYAIFTGMRGYRSVTTNTVPNFASSEGDVNGSLYTGFWTSGLSSNFNGRPINLLLKKYDSNVTQNFIQAFHDNNDPYFGASCRCVKVKTDGTNEAGPIPRLQVTTVSAARATNVLAKKAVEEKIVQNKLEVFPNPVKSILYIKGNDKVKEYYYQIYNMSGQLIKSGKFENEQTDLSGLISGAYLIRINNSDSIVKIIKE
ncbi:T9SS type A sorting domain-containing protein [Chryseobacterium sp. MYb328]|uniref:T9SS type A sorting domain-containing protein n=1 Tax=Chryseobacterium sp. MYb328 TaxID=2745231 RepID=UPI0030B64E42